MIKARLDIKKDYPDASDFQLHIKQFDEYYNSYTQEDGHVEFYYEYERQETDEEYQNRIIKQQKALDKWIADKKAQENKNKIDKENELKKKKHLLRELMQDFSINELKNMVTQEKNFRNSSKR